MTYRSRNKCGIIAMSRIVITAIEDPDSLVLRGQAFEEFDKANFIVHLYRFSNMFLPYIKGDIPLARVSKPFRHVDMRYVALFSKFRAA